MPDVIFFDAAGTLIQVREPVGVVYSRIATNQGSKVTSSVLAEASPSACLHFGDDAAADIDGAEAVGMQAFHVCRPESGLDQILL